MDDRHQAARRRLEDAVLRGPASLEPGVRTGLASGRDVPEDLRALADKVARQAYRVTDEDFAPLRARYSEDQLFEVVVSVALGAALTRVDAALRALEEA